MQACLVSVPTQRKQNKTSRMERNNRQSEELQESSNLTQKKCGDRLGLDQIMFEKLDKRGEQLKLKLSPQRK